MQICCCSVAQSCLTLWNSMDCSTKGCMHSPSLSPKASSNSCPLSWWCHPTISFSVILFSSHLLSFPASGSFQISSNCLNLPFRIRESHGGLVYFLQGFHAQKTHRVLLNFTTWTLVIICLEKHQSLCLNCLKSMYFLLIWEIWGPTISCTVLHWISAIIWLWKEYLPH